MTDMRSRAIATDDSRVVEPASDATPEITAAATSEATPEVTAAETNDRKVVDENQAIPTLDPLAGSTSSVPSLEPLPSSGEGPELSAVSGGGQMSTDSGTRASEGADEEMTLRAELREILQGSGIADLPEDPVTAVRALNAELHRLRPLADDGRAYRAELTDETVELGIKAFGDTFPAEQRRAMFAKLELSDIRGFRDEYRAIADKVLPEGRASHETDQSPGEPSEMAPGIGMQTRDRSTLPVDAFVA